MVGTICVRGALRGELCHTWLGYVGQKSAESAKGDDFGPAALEAVDAPQALLLASQMLLLAAIAASLPTGATAEGGLKGKPPPGVSGGTSACRDRTSMGLAP